eukprot:s428_g2.t3
MLQVRMLSGGETSIPVEEIQDVRGLKRHLNQLRGFPLGFRQRILLHDKCMEDDDKLEPTMNLQIVLLDFAEVSQQHVEDLAASAREGSLSKVRYMLQQPQDPDLHSSQGYTALMVAADGGQVDIVRLLLEAAADVDLPHPQFACRALMVASFRHHIEVVKTLLEARADTNVADNSGRTALMIASDAGHIEVVSLLLQAGADRDVADTVGCTALMVASDAGRVNIVCLLLKAGSTQDVVDNHGRPALTRASSRRQVDIVNVLLQALADTNVAANDGATALMVAIEAGDIEIVRLLLEARAAMDAADDNGRTALMAASFRGRVDIVNLLLEAGADKDVVDRSQRTPLMMASDTLRAANYGWLAWGELAAAPPTRADAAALEQEFTAGVDHAKVVSLLLQAGTDEDAADNTGSTALMKASFRRHIEVVKVLLEAHADTNVADNNGRTALMMASDAVPDAGHVEVLSLLLQAGADKNVADNSGCQALMLACSRGHVQGVSLLLEARADKDVADFNGRTALMMASAAMPDGRHVEIVQLLLQAGTNKNATDDSGSTALMIAASGRRAEIVNMLLQAHADKDVRGNGGRTALMMASAAGYVEVISLLLEAGADKNVATSIGDTALMMAVDAGHSEAVRLLSAVGSLKITCPYGDGTLGVLLRRLIADGAESMFQSNSMTHLVLDEVHERSLDMDFVLTLLQHCLPSRPELKVLLMSATMDVQSLAGLFQSPPPVLKIPGRTFPVDEFYLGDVEDLLGTVAAWSSGKGGRHEEEADDADGAQAGGRRSNADALRPPSSIDYDLVCNFILSLVSGSLTSEATKQWPLEGSILVFMPGAGEISRLIGQLEKQGSGSRFRALPLHGALKVIVATNVAETSVTLPDVTIVIDTCRERRLTRDHGHTTLAPALLERFCAKDSLKQRKGRAGRVQRGLCFRLLPRRDYERLPESTAPEIESLPLETLVLQVRAAGFHPTQFLANAPSPPAAEVVRAAEGALGQLGALKAEASETEGPEASLTALGRHLAALPCDVRVGRLVVLGAFLGVASATCGIAGWLSVRSPMPKAFKPSQEAARQALRAKALKGQGGSKSDHCLWVAIMEAFVASNARRSFCFDLGLSYERMVEAEASRAQLLRGLRSLGFQKTEADCNAGDWRVVRAAVVAGLYPQVAKVERPPLKFADSLAGSIQVNNDAREIRYWIREEEEEVSQAPRWRPPRVRAFLHPSSLLFKENSYACPYVMYSDKMVQQQNHPRHPTKLVLTGCSEASVYALLLFGGDLAVDHKEAEVKVDGWADFAGGSTTVVAMIQRLRAAIDALLLRKVQEPSEILSGDPVAQCVVTLLTTDGLG